MEEWIIRNAHRMPVWRLEMALCYALHVRTHERIYGPCKPITDGYMDRLAALLADALDTLPEQEQESTFKMIL